MATISKYNKGAYHAAIDPIDWNSDTIKVMLTTSTYTPAATHEFKSSVTNEVSGTGYTAGGATITLSAGESSGTTTLTATNVTWSQNASGFSNARYAVIYKSTGADATSPLLFYIDMVSDRGNVSGDLTLKWNGGASSGTLFTIA
jgi:hypothetical protein